MRRNRVVALAAAFLLVVGACSKDDAKTATTTTRQRGVIDSTDSGDGTAASTAVPPHPGALNGLEEADPAIHARPPLVVKIDNAPKARPQFGLGSADIVVEEGVEGGITRLAAMFHSQDAPLVGPVRSARSSDLHLAVPLGRPLFAYSGTNSNFQALIDRSPLIDVGISRRPSAYHRDRNRPAPYNLFSRTPLLFASPPAGAVAPKKLVDIGGPTAGATGVPVTKVDIHWVDKVRTDVTWTWDGTKWNRAQGDGKSAPTPTVDANGPGVHPRNVVVLFVNYEDTGERDQSNSIVPEAKLTGSGEAWIMRDGTLVRGTWTKPSQDAPIALADARGARLALLPGQTWIELPSPGNATVV